MATRPRVNEGCGAVTEGFTGAHGSDDTWMRTIDLNDLCEGIGRRRI